MVWVCASAGADMQMATARTHLPRRELLSRAHAWRITPMRSRVPRRIIGDLIVKELSAVRIQITGCNSPSAKAIFHEGRRHPIAQWYRRYLGIGRREIGDYVSRSVPTQPNVNEKTSTPASRNSISNWRSRMGAGCRIS
jgi:hypothetical protein